jgi:putative Flp pilus-assembly TadE/G-like protein
MRMTPVRDERGLVGVWFAVLLVVFLGMLALTMDGGLIYVRTRAVQNGNDAAALAAALSCARGLGSGDAVAEAQQVFTANSGQPATAWSFGPSGLDLPTCSTGSGTVTAYYGGTQTLYISPAIGVSSPATIHRKAKATWGAAGGFSTVAPLMLSMNRLSNCSIPDGVAVGTSCGFWFNNGNNGNQPQDLTNAEWGWMDLRDGVGWNIGRYTACPGNTNPPMINGWLTNGVSLTLASPGPTYACQANGDAQTLTNPGSTLQNLAINHVILAFPVNDPTKQVDKNGNLCPPGSGCSVDKYAIVGFAWLQVTAIYKGNTSEAVGAGTPKGFCYPHPSDANAKCLVATWEGFTTTGLEPSGGQSFGITAVALTG